MYKDHPALTFKLSDATIIWRFLDLPKFISILEKQALFFCKINTLDDYYEGCYSDHQRL